ncbi:ATP-binding cassette domain-containing protein [Micromonospora eburnea]|uniref:Oleandomycin transport system ATP-binding protein n=1 Tax=Micromonospora eburnea TaxID=227316 RepID=A0A1C6UH99_9ACTN|nr:ATP-binding cassette domain-containing protein [Micromonospora eburnea]SCL53351.1 oleandomycin transport system ATP-binding protein [Micromonospora eburnea]
MQYGFQAEALVKRFGTNTALNGVEFAARAGTVLSVLGPNGAGKTTAVRILATLLRPDSGTATVGGIDVVRHPARVRRLIGIAGQDTSVDEELTGAENLVLIGQLLDLRKAEATARAGELLERFELTEAAGRRVSTYSGGMRRRLDLAASMIGRPQVIFLDEPTTGLDPAKRDEVWRMIRTMAGDGTTVLLTTQYLEEADNLSDDIVVLGQGKVIANGSPDELKQIVGGQTIQLRAADPAQVSEAAAILGSVAGHVPDQVGPGVITVPVVGDSAFTEVVRQLAAANIAVTELSLRLPSLDEVFFTLTGRHTAEPEREQEVAA